MAAVKTSAALTLLALAAGCTRAPQRPPMTPCVLPGVTREAKCLELEVPENPDLPTGKTLRLHAAVVPATGVRPLPDAIFIFAGGPGQAATDVAGGVMPLFAGLEARRDVVFLDQRGTGRSAPLRCPDDGRRRPLAEAFDQPASEARLLACRDAFTDAGVDLAQYSTWIAMKDVEAVRLALGYGPINLWGASYGTRAALEYARQFPGSVRSVVIDGVAPALEPLPVTMAFDGDRALEQLIDRADGGLAALAEVLADGGRVTTLDPYFGTPQTFELTANAKLGLVRGPLYVPMLSAALPAAIRRAADGEWSALLGLSTGLGGGTLSSGMHFSVLCAEDVPRITAEQRARVASTRVGVELIEQYERSCRGWPTRPVPEAFFAPPTVAAPTLLLSGGTDPVTPPPHAEAVAKSLPNALHLVAPALGHGVSTAGCAPLLVHQFISRGSIAGLDGGCLRELPSPSFFEEPRP